MRSLSMTRDLVLLRKSGSLLMSGTTKGWAVRKIRPVTPSFRRYTPRFFSAALIPCEARMTRWSVSSSLRVIVAWLMARESDRIARMLSSAWSSFNACPMMRQIS